MAMSSYPSIQSFYQKEDLSSIEKHGSAQTKVIQGDAFTEDELAGSLDPLIREWNPDREYESKTISQLTPGPKLVTFIGRIVNFSTVFGSSPKQPKASGWHYLIIKDDGAAISVKLYFARTAYPIQLGQLLTIWTAFISDTSKTDSKAVTSELMCANMFPGRVTSDHLIIHASRGIESICHTPLDYHNTHPLPGLMTLKSFLTTGHDGVRGAKILVSVKSIGPRKQITKRSGGEIDLAMVMLFDHTAEVKLNVWGEMIDSAKSWSSGKTVLLITNPGYKVEFAGRGNLSIQRETMVDVDPECADADWLRRYATWLTKKEGLCVHFPEGMWDVDAAEYGVMRALFTLADLDDFVRSDPSQVFTGFLNVTIMEMSLVLLQRRNMLMCTECCGIPIYANTLTTTCRNCSTALDLSVNPKIVGTLLDETGCIAPGKLLWSQRAWEQLFGRTQREITEMTIEELRTFEQMVLFMRLHLVFGWAESVGRLAVLGIKS